MVTETVHPATTPVESLPESSARTAQDVMSADLLFVDEDLTLTELADFLTDHRISGAAVRDPSGRPIGVVSLSDLAATRRGPSPPPAQRPRGFYDLGWDLDEEDSITIVPPEDEARVGDIMTPEVISVDRATPIPEIAQVMLDANVHRVLVSDGDALVGIVTTSDLLTVLAAAG